MPRCLLRLSESVLGSLRDCMQYATSLILTRCACLTRFTLVQMHADHARDVSSREAAYVQGIQELDVKLQEVDSERTILIQSLQQSDNALEETKEKLFWLNDSLTSKAGEAEALLTANAVCQDRWSVCAQRALTKAATSRVFGQWRDLSQYSMVPYVFV